MNSMLPEPKHYDDEQNKCMQIKTANEKCEETNKNLVENIKMRRIEILMLCNQKCFCTTFAQSHH